MKTVLLFPFLLVLLFASAALQDLLPGIPPCQERILLLPVVFCFGMLALPPIPALFLALATAVIEGLMTLQVQSGQVEFGITAPVVFFLSWAIVLQMASEATQGMRWELHSLGSACVTATLLGGQFLLICIHRGGLNPDLSVALRIAVPAATSLLIAPLLYVSLASLVPVAPEVRPLPDLKD